MNKDLVDSSILDNALKSLPSAPRRQGLILDLCVRPGPDLREPRDFIDLCPERGAIGDRWERKTWMYLADGRPDPRVQVAVSNQSILEMIRKATGVNHHPGDTLFTDLDLSEGNLPAGSHLQAGEAILEVSDVENDACAKFAQHYGTGVFHWIRAPHNRALRLRGLFARVVKAGRVTRGDTLKPL